MNPKGGQQSRPRGGLCLKLASGMIIVALIVALSPPSKASAASISATALIDLTNSSRASAGLPMYSVNSKLVSSANMKANDILDNDYFAHTSPQGATPWSWFIRAGYDYSYAGENLAIDFYSSSGVHSAWMASDSHRANILDRNFTQIGVAVVSGEYQGQQTIVVVQHFGRPQTQSISRNVVYNQNYNNRLKNDQPESVQPPENNVAKNSQEILSESKIEVLVFPQKEIALSIFDLLFPPLLLIKKLV